MVLRARYGRRMVSRGNSNVVTIAYGSLAVGVLVLALKAFAAYATGSIALYSDALESVVNVVTAIVALVAIRFAARPADANLQAKLKPVYETLEGWKETTHGARSWADLPANAIKYVRRVEELIGAPVALLSTSPDRDDTIMVRDPFLDH